MIRCIKLRRYEKNTLRGFVDLELSRVGLVIHGCTWHVKGGKEWVSFPAQRYEDQGGNTLWSPIVEFLEGAKDEREQFRRAAIDAIHEAAEEAAND